MSGGSFDYVYGKDAGDLLSEYRERELYEMADAVENGWICAYSLDEGEKERLVALLRALAGYVESARKAVDAQFDDDVRNLLKAIEWAESGDWGPETVKEAFNEL